MICKARALWGVSGRAENGDLSSTSGVLTNTPYSFRTRVESQKGTNPEELIAAAHTGCFTMASAFRLQVAGYTATELSSRKSSPSKRKTRAFVSRFALMLRASLPDLDQGTFARVAQDAELNCPLSRVLRAEITLDAKLV